MVAMLLALVLAGEVSDAEIETYAKRSQLERPAAIAAAKKQLIAVRRDRSLDKTRKRQTAAALTAKVKQLSDESQPYYAPLRFPLHSPGEGGLGYVEDTVEVLTVIDEQSAIVEAYFLGSQYVSDRPGRAYRRPMRTNEVPYWLANYDTSKFVDGELAELRGVFKLSGTKTYETELGGTNTVRVLEWVDVAAHANRFAAETGKH